MSRAKRVLALLPLTCATVLMVGCSGINHSQGVSPATFLLPGLVQHEETDPGIDLLPESYNRIQVVQKR